MTKYIIDLPDNTHHIKGFTTYGFNSEREIFNIPVTMLKQFGDTSSDEIFKYEKRGI